jgi:catechol 2,3-dioxygenase
VSGFPIAQLAHGEYLTPKPDETLWFFKDLLGMQETHREGQSVYLRGYQETYHHGLVITESEDAGLGHGAWRTSSPEALEEVAANIEATGLGKGWSDDEIGQGRTYQFETPDGHKQEIFWEVERFEATPEQASRMQCAPQKRPLQGVPIRRIDHLNLMAADLPATKKFYMEQMGFALRENIILPDDSELGSWFSVSPLPHELAVMQDMTGTRGRLHHIAFWLGLNEHLNDAAEMLREHHIEIEAGPSKHGITQSPFMYVYEPGGNRVELFGSYGYLIFEPDWETKTWTEENLAVGGSIYGLDLPSSFFAYGTPNVEISEEHETGVFQHQPAAMPAP